MSRRSAIPKLPSGAPRPRSGWDTFTAGAREILWAWDLLKTAVVEEWGGRRSRDKFDVLVDDLIMNCDEQWREGNDLHLDTLDEYLLECLESDFNIDFEDDSFVTAISSLLQDLYRKCAEGDATGADALLNGLDKHPAIIGAGATVDRTGGGSSDDDDDGSGSDGGEEGDDAGATGGAGGSTSSSRPKRVVDEDGWETIVPASKGRGGKAGGKGDGGGMSAPGPSANGGAGGGGRGTHGLTTGLAALAMADDGGGTDDEAGVGKGATHSVGAEGKA